MANPWLVIGGVVLGVVTAGFGVAQIPGWVESGQDGGARNDLAQISIGEEAALTISGGYTDRAGLLAGTATDGAGASVKTGVKVQLSEGPITAVAVSADESRWAAVTVSQSGRTFIRTSDSAKVWTVDNKNFTAAVTAIRAQTGFPTGITIAGTAAAPTITFATAP